MVSSASEKPVSWPLISGLAFLAVWGLWGVFRWWTYPPPVEFDNLRYIQLLRTAVSSERPEMVMKVRQAVDLRVSEGKMSSPERAHFEEILKLADESKWKAAHQVCFRFEEAQLHRRRSHPPREDGHADHSH